MRFVLWLIPFIVLYCACAGKTKPSKTSTGNQVQRETTAGRHESGGDARDPLLKYTALLERSKGYSIVVSAHVEGVWLNGKFVGKLQSGAVPGVGPDAESSVYELPRLKRRFEKEMLSLPLSEWNLLLVVSLSVEAEVVQRILQAAGLAGITKYKIERVP